MIFTKWLILGVVEIMKRKTCITLFLLLGVILAGCGGGGGGSKPKPPTSANLRAAGKQIIDDTRAVWGYKSEDSILEPKFMELIEKTGDIKWYVLTNAINRSLWGAEIGFYKKLFRLSANEDNAYEENYVRDSSDSGEINLGNWKVNSDEGSYVLDINRSINGTSDIVEYTITNKINSAILYKGKVTYSTNLLTSYQENSDISVELKIKDDQLKDSTFNGTYKQIRRGDLGVHGEFNGNFDFKFIKDGQRITYEGSIKLSEDITTGDELVMRGRFVTPYLVFDGDIKASFVENSSSEYGFFPNKAGLQGTIQSLDKKYSLNGNYSVEIKNAAKIDPDQDQSARNFYHRKISFGGSFANNGSKVETKFTIEEVRFERYKVDVEHKFKNGGVERRCSIGLAQTNTGYHMDINSTWGPATVKLDATNDASGDISDVKGTVAVNGTQVGKIKLDDGLLKVKYNDGSFETF